MSSCFKKVLPYAVVVFFGYVGFAMPLPILPEMFLDPEKSILPFDTPEKIKTFLLGTMMSAYPLGQLIGAPVLGKCSDRWGRRKIILYSLFGAMLGYAFTALGASQKSIGGIFFGLFFCGLCEGNIAIAQSVAADLSDPKEGDKKVSYFGWINLFACAAFIIGPILGGVLADPEVCRFGSFATPFWAALILTLVGIWVVVRFSEETLKQENKKIGYWEGFRKGFQNKDLLRFYLVNFFLACGYFSYFRFFPVYLQEQFQFNPAEIGYAIAYGSFAFAIAALFFMKKIGKKFSPQQAIALFSIILAISLLSMLIPNSAWSLLGTIPLIDLNIAVVMTYGSILISNHAPPGFQGQAFGILTSVQVSAEIITGFGGGVLVGYFASLPMIIGSLFLTIASLILLASLRPKVDDRR